MFHVRSRIQKKNAVLHVHFRHLEYFQLTIRCGIYLKINKTATKIKNLETVERYISRMHPDTGAIIGIALAGSVLLMASLLLCILHLPCCKNAYKIRNGNGNRRNIRPSSTSSHAAFANMEFHPSSRNIDELSAANLHHQNQAYICSATGIVNPMWQIRCTCHPSGMMTSSQQSLNFAPCVSINSHNHCQFHQPNAPPLPSHLDHPSNTVDSHSFQYYAPQLLSPTDSPPPYPGTNQEDIDDPSHLGVTTNPSPTHPPPYSPKRNSVMI